jgi:hypothetical protein
VVNIDDDLPVEFRASHADRRSDWISSTVMGVLAVAITLGVLATILPGSALPDSVLVPVAGLLFVAVPIGCGLFHWSYHTNVMSKSWCKFTKDGVEFNDQNGRKYFPWADITAVHINVEKGYQASGPPKYTWHLIEVSSRNQKFKISSRYFTEEELMEMRRIFKFKCSPTTKQTRYN